MATTHSAQHGTDKAARLIDYLTAVASLRSKVVRTVDQYDKVFWLDDIPAEKECFSRPQGNADDYSDDIWVEVTAAKEPPFPSPPDSCKDWVDSKLLKEGTPHLMESIEVEISNPDHSPDNDEPETILETRNLPDYPKVSKAFDKYCVDWLDWQVDHSRWETIQQAYSQLFKIYKDLQKLGEEYELVIGLGLLSWSKAKQGKTKRHLIVADAQIEFESHLGRFSVKPAPEGAKVRTELEMLDASEQSIEEEEAYRELITAGGDNPWDNTSIFSVLESLSHSMRSDCVFHKSLEAPDRIGEIPAVHYAPALILRKRSKKGLTETLKKIKERILGGSILPTEFGNLIEQEPPHQGEREHDADHAANSSFDGEIFFPKLSNDEQRQIVEKLRHKDSLLVQGPPGTGKSHTIANLICHFLATGQRTLITAKTPRALKVLEAQLPEELRCLSINLLGGGMDEHKSLEGSIRGILHRKSVWNDSGASLEASQLKHQLHCSRKELAAVTRRLLAIRESETHTQDVGDGAYKGTAAQIAKQVRSHSDQYVWFNDNVEIENQFDLDIVKFTKALHLLRHFTPEKKSKLSMVCPTAPFSSENFHLIVSNEKNAVDSAAQLEAGADLGTATKLSKLPKEALESITLAHQSYEAVRAPLAASRHFWTDELMNAVLSGQYGEWNALLVSTEEKLTIIRDANTSAEGNIIENPLSISPQILYKNTESICKFLKGGGKIGWGIFNSSEVKPHLKILKGVLINGHPCTQLKQFLILRDTLLSQIQQQKLSDIWNSKGITNSSADDFFIERVIEARDLLLGAFSLKERASECQNSLFGISNIKCPTLSDESEIQRFLSSCTLAVAIRHKHELETKLSEASKVLSAFCQRARPHPTAPDLLKAISVRSPSDYEKALLELNEVIKDQAKLEELNTTLSELKSQLPIFTEKLEKEYNADHWEQRIQMLQKAWEWRQANGWLHDYIRKDDALSLETQAKQLEDKINDLISRSAANLAWQHCFEKLTDSHERGMQAWQQSMKRLGKGTGKHAPKHRREAQQHLNSCKDAVPAWVMPLHRIWDTITPEPEMFDVIIVDEASQCGLEGLPLTFLAKKILIVGDDKQISPEAVGYNESDIDQLKEKYLKDFDLKSTFHIQSSLFDHANVRFGSGRVTLREHFRCMPEIIRFSNDLCYSDTPLIPLRQYSPDRLQPTRHVLVSDGYREGKYAKVINRPEAEQIVEAIAEICKDDRYNDKSLGVISLQGDAQSELIESMLLERIGAEEIEDRKLVCGNAYSFQGDERDVVFMSMVAAPNARIGALTKSSDQQRFNVATSRARDQLFLFHSVTTSDLSQNCLRRKLLDFFQDTTPQTVAGIDKNALEMRALRDERSIINPPTPFDSWFEVDVALEIAKRGYDVSSQFAVGKKRIDLVVEGGHARLAVECDGDHWHGTDEYESDMQRQRQLERAGWEFLRVRESMFYANKADALNGLWELLEARGILPHGSTQKEEEEDAPSSEERSSEPENTDEKTSGHSAETNDSPSPPTEASNNSTAEVPSKPQKAKLQDLTAPEIQTALLTALNKCPNRSCTLKSAPKISLKELGIITRGNPLVKFTMRLHSNIRSMEAAGKVELYKATNERIRLSRDYLL
jgi:very-short-patch-repair endonuclease